MNNATFRSGFDFAHLCKREDAFVCRSLAAAKRLYRELHAYHVRLGNVPPVAVIECNGATYQCAPCIRDGSPRIERAR